MALVWAQTCLLMVHDCKSKDRATHPRSTGFWQGVMMIQWGKGLSFKKCSRAKGCLYRENESPFFSPLLGGGPQRRGRTVPLQGRSQWCTWIFLNPRHSLQTHTPRLITRTTSDRPRLADILQTPKDCQGDDRQGEPEKLPGQRSLGRHKG